MRKINRLMKVTFDIPAFYDNEEEFMMDLADKLDAGPESWELVVSGGSASIKKITLGDIEIDPEG